ncbi:hypothetical protein MKX07_006513 [Trichoderma sp. CBMAI-0711]|nr:hypothetical protein MKX07_006513 [Trichoderma sp. CBMAI-0711]
MPTSNLGGQPPIAQLDDALREAPRAVLVGNRILHGGGDGRLDAEPAEAVLADGLDVAEAAQALLAGEAAVAGAGDAAKGQLDGVVGGEVVDGDHACLEAADDGLEGRVALGCVDGGAEAKVGGVCDGEDVLWGGGAGAEHGEDGGEALGAGDAHVRGDVDEERGLEVVAAGVVRVGEALAAGEEAGALGNGLGDEVLEAGEGGVGDHGAHVGVGAEADGLDAGLEQLDEAVVDGARGDDALDADAVLAGGLEGAPEDDVDDAAQVAGGGLEDDEGVLAAELGDDGGQALCGAGGDVVGDGLRADEGDVADARVRRQVAGRLGPADDGLDEARVVAVGDEGAAGNVEEVAAGPGRLLRDLDEDGVAGEEGADDGAHEVVEGVVPADEGGDDAQRLVVHRVALVRHEQVRRPARRPQRALAVRQRPLDLLDRHQDLAQLRVHHGLAAVQPRDAADLLGVVHDVLHQRPQHRLSLVKRRRGPGLLRFRCRGDGGVDAIFRRGLDGAEELARRGRVALDGGAAGDPNACVLADDDGRGGGGGGRVLLLLGEGGRRDDVAARARDCGCDGGGAGGADNEAADDGRDEGDGCVDCSWTLETC